MALPKISSRDGMNIVRLLKPYRGSLAVALIAVVGEGLVGLLEPWPLKIVFGSVSGSKPLPAWLSSHLPAVLTFNKMAILKLAAITVIAVAILDAVFSYVEKYATTSAGQWIMHDLRRMVYRHIQHLSPGPPFQGQIHFENVGFGYTADRPVLTDITLTAQAGRMTALVGPTGSGKTTIAALMGRFYDPATGKVKIDGADLREFEQKSSRPDQLRPAGQCALPCAHLAEHCLWQAGSDARGNSACS